MGEVLMKVFRVIAAACGVVVAGGRASADHAPYGSPPALPLVEFAAVDDDTARYAPLEIENCGYYLRVLGFTGHAPTSRMGAAARLQGDTLKIWIDSYPASEIVIHDIQRARWTLRVGGVGFHHVDVIAGSEHVTREMALPGELEETRVRGCSSGY